MEKTIYTHEYRALLKLLREARRTSGLTQVQLAAKLKITQSVLSKVERGERRIDVVELRALCTAMGVDLVDFVRRLERELRHPR